MLGQGFCLASIRAGAKPKRKQLHVSFGPAETIAYRVGKKTQRTGPRAKPRELAPACFTIWEEREWPAAQAARHAAELAFRLGKKPHVAVIFWDGEGVYALPYEDSVGKSVDSSARLNMACPTLRLWVIHRPSRILATISGPTDILGMFQRLPLLGPRTTPAVRKTGNGLSGLFWSSAAA